MKIPRSVDISITSHCNLRCKYCYFFGNPSSSYNDLSTTEWLEFFKELGSLSVMDVCLGGGEPFLRSDLVDLIDGIIRSGMRFSLVSNGVLVTDSMAVFLGQTRRLNNVQVSIDSAIPFEHDYCRGQGSWEGAVSGIRILQNRGVNVTARVTIHRHNYRNMKKTAEFILEHLQLPYFGTNAAGYIGRCRSNAPDLLLTVRERLHVMSELLELKRIYGDRIRANAGPLADAQMWRSMESAKREGASAFKNGGRLSGCGCVQSRISINSDGSVSPCNQLPHINLGMINHQPLCEIWLNHPELVAMRRRNDIALDSFEFCKDCVYIPYCTGNCPSRAYEYFGTIFHPSPDACLRLFLQEGGIIV